MIVLRFLPEPSPAGVDPGGVEWWNALTIQPWVCQVGLFQINALAGGEFGEVADFRGLLVQSTASFSHRTGLHECSVKWRRLLDTDTDLSGYRLNSVGGLECVSQHATGSIAPITSCQMHLLIIGCWRLHDSTQFFLL